MNAEPRYPRPIPRGALGAALALLTLPSCGDDNAGRPPRYPASGRILVDGKCVAGIQVRLHPVDRLRDVDALQPRGVSDAEGAYHLGSYDESDGAPAGRFKATLFWPDSPSNLSRPKDLFNGMYAKPESSRIEFTIAEGENRLAEINVNRSDAPAKRRPAGRRAPASGPDSDSPTAR
jgi:hypothetical protein